MLSLNLFLINQLASSYFLDCFPAPFIILINSIMSLTRTTHEPLIRSIEDEINYSKNSSFASPEDQSQIRHFVREIETIPDISDIVKYLLNKTILNDSNSSFVRDAAKTALLTTFNCHDCHAPDNPPI